MHSADGGVRPKQLLIADGRGREGGFAYGSLLVGRGGGLGDTALIIGLCRVLESRVFRV